MLDSVSDGDLRILYAWAKARAFEVEAAKVARNAAERQVSTAREALEEIVSEYEVNKKEVVTLNRMLGKINSATALVMLDRDPASICRARYMLASLKETK
jgi:hypothetical protein